MSIRRIIACPAAAVSTAVLLAMAATYPQHADHGAPGAAPAALIRTSFVPHGRTASKLGDLSSFRRIATDVAVMTDRGDLPAAKARIKDLEFSWDSAEAGLKPRAAADWHLLDKAIDKALAALRASTPKQTECRDALTDLLRAFDMLQGKV